MDAFPFASPNLKIAMIVTGLAVGVVDVKESGDKLKEALHEHAARDIGRQMIIADPFFVYNAWSEHLSACGENAWCYIPPPPPLPIQKQLRARLSGTSSLDCLEAATRTLGLSLDSIRKLPPSQPRSTRDCLSSATLAPDFKNALRPMEPPPNAWWRNLWPVTLVRMAIFPILQSGWTLFSHGWTARVVFIISLLAALGIAASATESSDSLPGAVVGGVVSFLVVSIAVSFAFNMLLRFGNWVAGYWGVLVALASGIYFAFELITKARELVHVAAHRGKK